jgi:hypothetical protein
MEFGIASGAALPQQNQDPVVSHLLRLCLWRCPRLRIPFYRVRPSIEQELRQFDPAPPACPIRAACSSRWIGWNAAA